MPGSEKFRRDSYVPKVETRKVTETPAGDEVQIFQRPERQAAVAERKVKDAQRAEALRQRLKESMPGDDEEAITPLKKTPEVTPTEPEPEVDVEDEDAEVIVQKPKVTAQDLVAKARAKKLERASDLPVAEDVEDDDDEVLEGGAAVVDNSALLQKVLERTRAKGAALDAKNRNLQREPVPKDSTYERHIGRAEFAEGMYNANLRVRIDTLNDLRQQLAKEKANPKAANELRKRIHDVLVLADYSHKQKMNEQIMVDETWELPTTDEARAKFDQETDAMMEVLQDRLVEGQRDLLGDEDLLARKQRQYEEAVTQTFEQPAPPAREDEPELEDFDGKKVA